MLLLIAAAVGIALLFFALNSRSHRTVKRSIDLATLLPENRDTTSFFVDVKLLRHAGYLDLLPGKVESDPQYRDFLKTTGFEYTRDVDALACTIGPRNEIECFLQGRFDWQRLSAYAHSHAGECRNDTCVLPGSQSNRWIQFSEIEAGVLRVRVTSNRPGLMTIGSVARDTRANLPTAPVWVRPAASLLQFPDRLPFTLRIFAITLQNAASVTISLNRATPPAVFNIDLDAWFENPAVADTASNQLQLNTKLLKIELGRAHGAPNPADLTGLLTAGRFTTHGKELNATWPVQKQLLDALR